MKHPMKVRRIYALAALRPTPPATISWPTERLSGKLPSPSGTGELISVGFSSVLITLRVMKSHHAERDECSYLFAGPRETGRGEGSSRSRWPNRHRRTLSPTLSRRERGTGFRLSGWPLTALTLGQRPVKLSAASRFLRHPRSDPLHSWGTSLRWYTTCAPNYHTCAFMSSVLAGCTALAYINTTILGSNT